MAQNTERQEEFGLNAFELFCLPNSSLHFVPGTETPGPQRVAIPKQAGIAPILISVWAHLAVRAEPRQTNRGRAEPQPSVAPEAWGERPHLSP